MFCLLQASAAHAEKIRALTIKSSRYLPRYLRRWGRSIGRHIINPAALPAEEVAVRLLISIKPGAGASQ